MVTMHRRSMRNEVTFYSDLYPQCRTAVRIGEALAEDGRIVVCITTGAVYLQTYATHDELRTLGEMLLRRANANEVLEVAA